MNRDLFTTPNKNAPPADTINQAGGLAYKMENLDALCQLAVTGTFRNTFYTSANQQLKEMLELAASLPTEQVALVAKYARRFGNMKDTPVVLLHYLWEVNAPELGMVWYSVIDNIGQLQNWVQLVRGGKRKSLASKGKRFISDFLASMTPEKIFWQAIGGSVDFKDVLRLAHPRPATPEHEALFNWFLGKTDHAERLPNAVKAFEDLKAGRTQEVPEVPFLRLSNLDLSTDQWKQVARRMTWNQLRLNLSSLNKHGVFQDEEFVKEMVTKLTDQKALKSSRILPFALYQTNEMIGALPAPIKNAVSDAMDQAVLMAPKLPGKTLILVDSSGSMSSPVTGYGPAASKMTCNKAAAYFAAALLKSNPDSTEVVLFDTVVHSTKLNPRDSLSTIIDGIRMGGGGTNVEVGIRYANHTCDYDSIIIISDNMSWDSLSIDPATRRGMATLAELEWARYLKSKPNAKLVAIDIQPYTSSQLINSASVLNIGGLNDSVFEAIDNFLHNSTVSWETRLGGLLDR
jgi:60 kDa SS-A/Ro ribonucleoprotein